MRRPFPWVLTIVCALAFALLVSLGVWQIQRMQWKQGLIAQAEAAAKLPPTPLQDVLKTRTPEFRRATIECESLAGARFVEVRSIEEGQAGTRLVSACRLPEEAPYDFIFVDRGFVSAEEARRPEVTYTPPLAVVGVLRKLSADDGMRSLLFSNDIGDAMSWREPAQMALALDAPNTAPFTLYSLTSSNPDWPALRPSAPPAAFSNNHLGYALTWFGLALALVGFYIALLCRKPPKEDRS